MGGVDHGWSRGRGLLCLVALAGALAAMGALGAPRAEAANGLEPVLDCIEYDASSETVTASLGYLNINGVAITPGPEENYFDPPPFFRNQPTTFEPGRHREVFVVTFTAGTTLTWHLFGSALELSNDPRYYCEGPDLTPPETAILEGPRGATAGRSASFQLFSEGGATFECSVDGAPFTECDADLTLDEQADGEHELRARAIDGAGNVDSTPATREWTVDATAPAAPAIGLPGSGATDRDGSFRVRGAAEPGSMVRLYEDGRPVGIAEADASTGAWSIGVVDAAEGAHYYRAAATDALGNRSPMSAAARMLVDTTAPRVVKRTPRRVARPAATVTVTFSEPIAPGSLGGALTLRMKGRGGGLVRAAISYDAASRTVKLDPARRLRPGRTYVAKLRSTVADPAGNGLGRGAVWSFSVR